MAASNRAPLWIGIAAAVIVFAVATWLTRNDLPDGTRNAEREAMEQVAQPAAETGSDTLDAAARIPEHGRLSLDADTLTAEEPLTLILDLPDEARGDGLRTVRIVSGDGRRIDTTANSLAGPGTGIRLDIDSEFLSRGLYMIEIDTVENTPLRIRRYVLELK